MRDVFEKVIREKRAVRSQSLLYDMIRISETGDNIVESGRVNIVDRSSEGDRYECIQTPR